METPRGIVTGGIKGMKTSPEEELEKKIGYCFNDIGLLKQALTHSSYANERKINRCKNYERLEFLGDAVLEMVSSDFLFRENPDMPEGRLTQMRASMVCEQSLAICARDLELGKFIYLGKGEAQTGGRERDSILADVCEAIIGAIYMDGGFEKAKEYVNRFVLADLEDKQLFLDSKTLLQEIAQKRAEEADYKLVGETGPEHDKIFEVELWIGGKEISRGSGRTKKAAEQQAAYEAVRILKDKE